MLSHRVGGCQLLEARLTSAILEGAGSICISLAQGLRPGSYLCPLTPGEAGEGEESDLLGGTSKDTSVPRGSCPAVWLMDSRRLSPPCPHMLVGTSPTLTSPPPPPHMAGTGVAWRRRGEAWWEEHWAKFSQLLPGLLCASLQSTPLSGPLFLICRVTESQVSETHDPGASLPW